MRNLLDESSIAQYLDGNRLMGRLLFPLGLQLAAAWLDASPSSESTH
jgi:hypothetical protein